MRKRTFGQRIVVTAVLWILCVGSISPVWAFYQTCELVSEVQTRLSVLGMYAGPIDGSLNRTTLEAITVFQKKQQINGGGYVDEVTLLELRKDTNALISNFSTLEHKVTMLDERVDSITYEQKEIGIKIGNVTNENRSLITQTLIEKFNLEYGLATWAAVIIGVLALVGTVAGYGIYSSAKNRINRHADDMEEKHNRFERNLENKYDGLEKSLQKKHEGLVSENENKIQQSTELLRHYEYAFVKLSTSNIYWNMYKDLADSSQKQLKSLHEESVKMAIRQSKRAHEYALENLKETKYSYFIETTKCNYSYHLASRGKPEDIEIALNVSAPLYELSLKGEKESLYRWYDYRETYAWVRFQSGDDELMSEAEKIIRSLLVNPQIPEDWKEEYKAIYKKKGLEI